MKVVILGKVHLSCDDQARLESIASVSVHKNDQWSDQELISAIGDAQIIISFLVPLSKEVISSAKSLKLISLATTGFNGIDLDAAKKYGVTVCSTPGYATESVAEHTFGLMLAAARMSFIASSNFHKGKYDPTEYTGVELKGKTLGVVGLGNIGTRVSEIAQDGFGMDVISTDSSSTRDDLINLLSKSDVITIHVPLSDETRGMIGEGEFKLMKNGVIIVNTARAGVIEESALIENLKSKKVFALGVDVLSVDSKKLLSLPNVVATPHIAFNTKEALNERSKIIVDNIEKFLEGNPQNAVCTP